MKSSHYITRKSVFGLAAVLGLALAHTTTAVSQILPVLPISPGPRTNLPPVLPSVGVIASDPIALEGISSGAFTLLRSGPPTNALTVPLYFSGTASNGVDYGPITSSVTIPVGSVALDIPVVPIIDNARRGNKTVILSLQSNITVSFLTRSRATVEIIDDIYNVQPPTVAITNPAEGTVYTNPAVITIGASASDPDVAITSVSFFANNQFLGSVSNSPYVLNWTNSTPGHYALFARAEDTVGQSAVSAAVNVTVAQLPPPPRPIVSIISPTNWSKFGAGTNIHVAATATETNGGIASVSFYVNNKPLGSISNSPYSLVWSNVPKGIYDIIAVATDTNGLRAYAEADITVTNKPVVTVSNSISGVVGRR